MNTKNNTMQPKYERICIIGNPTRRKALQIAGEIAGVTPPKVHVIKTSEDKTLIRCIATHHLTELVPQVICVTKGVRIICDSPGFSQDEFLKEIGQDIEVKYV